MYNEKELKERENQYRNFYKINLIDDEYVVVQKDSYFSEITNDQEEYYSDYKRYKTYKGAINGIKKAITCHFPKDYFDKVELDNYVKSFNM